MRPTPLALALALALDLSPSVHEHGEQRLQRLQRLRVQPRQMIKWSLWFFTQFPDNNGMHIEYSFAFSSRQSSHTHPVVVPEPDPFWPQKKRSLPVPCSLPCKISWNLLACTYMRTRRERNAQLRRFEFRILSRRFARTGELQFNQAVLGNIPCAGSMAARYQGTSIGLLCLAVDVDVLSSRSTC